MRYGAVCREFGVTRRTVPRVVCYRNFQFPEHLVVVYLCSSYLMVWFDEDSRHHSGRRDARWAWFRKITWERGYRG